MIFKLEKVMCLIVTALLILLQITCQDQTEVDFLCANDACTERISTFAVRTIYIPDTRHKIEAKKGDKGYILKIFKDAEINLFEVQIENGDKGFLPRNIIQETSTRKENLITIRLPIPSELILHKKSNKPDPAVNDGNTRPVSLEIDNSSLLDTHNESNSELTKPNIASTPDEEKSQSDKSIAPNDNSQLSENQHVNQNNRSDSSSVEEKSKLNNDTISQPVSAQETTKTINKLQSGQHIGPNDNSQLLGNQHVDQSNQSDSTSVKEKSELNNDTISQPVSAQETPKTNNKRQSGQHIGPNDNSQLLGNQHVDQSNQSDSTSVKEKSELNNDTISQPVSAQKTPKIDNNLQSGQHIGPNDNSQLLGNQHVDQSNQSDSTSVKEKSELNNDTISQPVSAQKTPKIDNNLQSGQHIGPNDNSQLLGNQHVDQSNQSDSTSVKEKSELNNDTISQPVSAQETPKTDNKLQSGQHIGPNDNSQLLGNQHVDQSNQSDSTPVAIKSENVKEIPEIDPANTKQPATNSIPTTQNTNNLNHHEANFSDSENSNKQSDELFTSTVKPKANINVRKPTPYAYMNAHQTKPEPPRNQVKNSDENITQSSSRIDVESSEVRENVSVETNTSGAIPVGFEMPPKNPPEPAESLKPIDSYQEINGKAQVTKRESLPSVSSTEQVPETKPVETDPATEGISSAVNDSEILEKTDESRNPSETYMKSIITQEPAQQDIEQTLNGTVDTSASGDLKQVTSDSNSSPNDSQKSIESDETHIPVETDRVPSVPFRIPLAHQPMESVDNLNDVSSSVSDSSEGEENATDASQPLPVSVSNTESENNFGANVLENIQNKISSSANYEQVQIKSQQIPPPVHSSTPSDQSIIPQETSTSPTIEESSTPSVPKVEESTSISPPVQSTDESTHGYYGTPSISSSFSATPEGQLEPNDNLSDKSILSGTPESLNSDSKFSGESKPDIQSETTTLAFDTDEKHSLNDFIHGPRKKVNENDVETVDNQEKSIYETIQGYLPDFSGFDIGNILPKDSMEQFFGIFDFKKTSQEQEETNKEFCEAESFCGTDRLNSFVEPDMTPSHQSTVPSLWGEITDHNKEQIVWTSGVVSVILFGLIVFLYLIDRSNKKNRSKLLVSKINDLEKKLMISTKEIASLQEQLIESNSQANEKQNIVETKRIGEVYEHKINQYKKRIVELEDKVSYLEKELEDVAGSALEMHKLLENSLTTQACSKAAIDEMETLRSLTESQEMQIEELKKEINAIITENQCLKVDSEMDKSAIKKLEKECSTQTKKNLELSEKNRNLTLQLDKEIENNNALENNYKSEIYQLRSKLEDVEMNLKRSEFQVQELNRVFLDKQEGKTADEKMATCDEMQLKMQVATLEAMNVELGGQLKEEKNARRMLEDHVGDIIKELNNLKKTYESSEKERNEAVTKLQVLTQYFKDKEAQLRKELEAKDKLYLERESKDQSLSQKLAFMREEINTLKTVNEELKKEIHDQEASYKLQLANAEQKTREHWFALRQAERKYKECQQEAASLRNKILVLENSLSSVNQKPDDKNNSVMNGDIPSIIPSLYHSSVSPELLPFPPSEFIPPPPSPIPSRSPDFFPPEPLYSPDERLPPLGGRRAPTPPPPIIPDDDEFSPPPPNMKYATSRNRNVEPPAPYSRRTPPPNSRHRSFKPKPRSSIDSPSSGMSLESLDKSGR